tara:strand:+ start:126 stop:743 length:618 start_codon:yes stop_codon:yes gene_type:complete
VTKRKKKLLFIQISIFLFATILLYFAYNDGNKIDKKTLIKPEDKQNAPLEKNASNNFEDVEYKGVDLNGNRYVIQSEKARFELDKPELIDMKVMHAIFYFKDGSILKIWGDYGTYNNQTKDMEFRENIIATRENENLKDREKDYLYADNLDYLNSEGLLSIYGNVVTESIEGSIIADKIKIDLESETLNASMFDNSKVKVKVKEK